MEMVDSALLIYFAGDSMEKAVKKRSDDHDAHLGEDEQGQKRQKQVLVLPMVSQPAVKTSHGHFG